MPFRQNKTPIYFAKTPFRLAKTAFWFVEFIGLSIIFLI